MKAPAMRVLKARIRDKVTAIDAINRKAAAIEDKKNAATRERDNKQADALLLAAIKKDPASFLELDTRYARVHVCASDVAREKFKEIVAKFPSLTECEGNSTENLYFNALDLYVTVTHTTAKQLKGFVEAVDGIFLDMDGDVGAMVQALLAKI
jgi:phytoene/squalene synthetase